jgi:glucose-1-phosphate adenylyltransferase
MGIYLFNRQFMVDVLTKTPYHDFGKEVFPTALRARHVQAHLFDDYWEDIGTIKAFYEANLSLAQADPPFDFHVPGAPIYTRARFLPPSVLNGATVTRSLIADGCRIGSGVVIENSVIGLRCQIGDNVTIRDSVVMGSDFYDDDRTQHQPRLGIGENSVIRGAILDKNCRLGRGVRIYNEADLTSTPDASDCMIQDGIPVVLKDAVLPDGWQLPA